MFDINKNNNTENNIASNKRRSVIVTGASRGIGRAIAVESAKAGFNVAISCRANEGLLDSVSDQIKAYGVSCRRFVGDMSDKKDVRNFFSLVRESYGHADILVNNAGISSVGLFQDVDEKAWHNIFKNNLDSAFFCTQQFLDDALDRKDGRIINISSVWGEVGASCEASYSATKGALNALTKSLAKELAPSGIAVNAVSCGIIDTDMNACFSSEEIDAIKEEIPTGRLGTPAEIASVVVSLFSAPKYLTGQIIRTDGGWI